MSSVPPPAGELLWVREAGRECVWRWGPGWRSRSLLCRGSHAPATVGLGSALQQCDQEGAQQELNYLARWLHHIKEECMSSCSVGKERDQLGKLILSLKKGQDNLGPPVPMISCSHNWLYRKQNQLILRPSLRCLSLLVGEQIYSVTVCEAVLSAQHCKLKQRNKSEYLPPRNSHSYHIWAGGSMSIILGRRKPICDISLLHVSCFSCRPHWKLPGCFWQTVSGFG